MKLLAEGVNAAVAAVLKTTPEGNATGQGSQAWLPNVRNNHESINEQVPYVFKELLVRLLPLMPLG